jgi:hypothetical protein
MSWSREDLDRIGGATEPEIASARPDGTLRSHSNQPAVR